MKQALLAIGIGITLASQIASAETRKAGKEALRQDVETLKQDQQAMHKDIEEIKRMLQARPEPTPGPLVQAVDRKVDIGDAPVKGDREAKLTLMEFSDYQCPYCKRHADNTLSQIDKEYIATGKVRYVFRDFPLEAIHAQAGKAAEAAHCAGDQGKYWEMHDHLFANQQALEPNKLPAHAEAIGLDAEAFKQCLESGKYGAKVRQDMADAIKFGINGTPTLLLGISDGDKMKDVRIIRGARPFVAFQQEIDKMLSITGDSPEKIGKN